MTWEELYYASEEEQIAELIGMGIEYADEYSQVDLEPFRRIYKKYCLEHGIIPDKWYLGIYD